MYTPRDMFVNYVILVHTSVVAEVSHTHKYYTAARSMIVPRLLV